MKRAIALFFLTGCTLQPGSGCLVPGQTASSAMDVEACTHLSDKAQATLTAASSELAAPSILTHGRLDVALPANQAGYLSWKQDETSDVSLYLDQPIAVSVLDAAGEAVTPLSRTNASDSFGAIKHKSVYHLDTGTYWVKLGPAAVATVGLVIEVAHEEEGDDHGHAH